MTPLTLLTPFHNFFTLLTLLALFVTFDTFNTFKNFRVPFRGGELTLLTREQSASLEEETRPRVVGVAGGRADGALAAKGRALQEASAIEDKEH